jgi:small subunit ribosomal protein S17
MDKQEIHITKSNKGKNFVGTVIALYGEKTAKVEVPYEKKHPLYKKTLKRTRRFACHNELSGVTVGDHVEIAQMRPMSKTKHFRIVKKI